MCFPVSKLRGSDGFDKFCDSVDGDYWDAREEAWLDYLYEYVDKETKDEDSRKIVKDLFAEYAGKYNIDDFSEWAYKLAGKYYKEDNKAMAQLIADITNSVDEDFEFPDEDTWINEQYESAVSAYEDRCYDEMRDRELGL